MEEHLGGTIPNSKTFLHECSKVTEAREYEGVDIFWLVWPWNNTTNMGVTLLIAVIWTSVHENPDVYLDIGHLVAVKLGIIKGKH